jgi:hypothetical protein
MSSPLLVPRRRFLVQLTCGLAAEAATFLHADEPSFTTLCYGRDLTGWRNPYAWGKAEIVDGEI